MPTPTHHMRLLDFLTPLGKDSLLIHSITGREAISQLFSFDVEAFAPNTADIDFSRLIGQPAVVTVALKNDEKRFFHGIIKSVVRGVRSVTATSYRFEIVPSLWLLSQRTQSRIFQQISVPDILKKVLEGLDVDFEFTGTFEPRDYCVQYRESDFAFASRLMEEEGMFYFFRHREDGHTLVVANSSQSHDDLPCDPKLNFDEERGGFETQDEIIYSWEKQQVLRPGKVTLWDHSFELPHKSLDSQEMVGEDLQIGDVTHKLKIAGNEKLEIFDFPGGYAQRFDGVSPGGGDRAGDLQKIYEDNQRTARIRMQQETVGAIHITAHTDSLHVLPGYKFELDRHYSDNDTYVITSSNVSIPQRGAYGTSEADTLSPPPEIVFNCIPLKLPFAPTRITPKPVIYGTQTALVVGPAGEEIFTDKYGRVKVQFFWDREGKFDGNSSCWVRVATPWAGKQFGMVHIPRIGQEVVVAFEEGDPDQPIIVGSVYNADQMPPHELPANKTQSGIKSRSTPAGSTQSLNEIRFEDKVGSEFIFINGEKDVHFRCKDAYYGEVTGDYNFIVQGETRFEHHNMVSRHIHADESTKIDGTYGLVTDGEIFMKAFGAAGIIGQSMRVASRTDMNITANNDIQIDSGGTLVLSASTAVVLESNGNTIALTSAGIHISGSKVFINSGSAGWSAVDAAFPDAVAPSLPFAPMTPGENRPTENPAAAAKAAANSHDEKAEENKDKSHWIEIELKDESGAPVQGESCEITLPNGKKVTRSTDKNGLIRVNKMDPGECQVRWLHLDQDAISE